LKISALIEMATVLRLTGKIGEATTALIESIQVAEVKGDKASALKAEAILISLRRR